MDLIDISKNIYPSKLNIGRAEYFKKSPMGAWSIFALQAYEILPWVSEKYKSQQLSSQIMSGKCKLVTNRNEK